MDLVSANCCLRLNNSHRRTRTCSFFGKDKDDCYYYCGCGNQNSSNFPIQSCSLTRYQSNVKAFASQNQTKKSRRRGKTVKQDQNLRPSEELPDANDALNVSSSDSDEMEVQVSVNVPSRSAVLQACTVTSGLIGALGVIVRQGSHIASIEGWPVIDCSTNITFQIELWHLGLIAGSVILVSSCRYILLKSWPEFAESSEAANRQVLTSLEPLDYLVVAIFPGISEEILFRGSLLPLLGMNWTSIVAVAALFGVLHLGNGRKYSFAVWATFVGVVYGYATIFSSSITVAMASHALNNLIGGIIWRYTSNSSKQIG